MSRPCHLQGWTYPTEKVRIIYCNSIQLHQIETPIFRPTSNSCFTFARRELPPPPRRERRERHRGAGRLTGVALAEEHVARF